ncbi:T9SS type A sorting domain-containing protein [Taibaiella chishuiensis]|uniref:Putative repeat protein (TIGR01451 family)/predicted secreted protein (Por secretion system target) n=1 Tax=Taibaiella chishuiensis TaxID=1434707 RepID=A0A2P8DCE9_9BACT|nr:T9SS type A sorting domain-containing protein [Taibaiella chishuiensis]PSK94857.1 putative repeat protein (TIGR01451 family)/predicted secreted protein (Por secretion system target) [Taibaiella chishuiensis]
MKKIFTTIALLGAFSFVASAQKTCDLKLEVTANKTSVDFGDTARLSFKVTNNGPAAIATTDTIFYGLKNTNRVFVFNLSAIASGASVNFANVLYLANDSARAADQPIDLCFFLFKQSEILHGQGMPAYANTYLDNIHTNDTTCVTVTLKKKTGTAIFDVNAGTKEALSIYPNPTHGSLNFNFNFDKAASATARITDITGRTVLVKDFGKTSVGNHLFTVDVSALTKGTYFVEFIADERRAISKFTAN